LSSSAGRAAAEQVLQLGVTIARRLWPERLVAAYALGSLAHGGFSEHVSDIDLGLVLADTLEIQDAERVGEVGQQTRASGQRLADRLSIFWGSPQILAGAAVGGRFPPVDLCDLRRFGRLLHGRDLRAQVRTPSSTELLVSGARFALARLADPAVVRRVLDPTALAAANVRTLTKLVLFPVRLLFTARTGNVGLNADAVAHFAEREAPVVAQLALRALQWRESPPRPIDVEGLLRAALRSLYLRFIAEFEQRLSGVEEFALAASFREWRRCLEETG